MQIKVGKYSGFCGGVKRSVLKAEESLNNGDVVYCYGELVHNKQVINSLTSKGLKVIDDINEAEDGSKVIFRAHGVEKKIYEIAEKKNLTIADLTCPNVLKIHEKALRLAEEGYFIILIAQVSHPETIGTISFCGDNCFILENSDMILDLENKIKESKCKRIAILTQTTISVDRYNELVDIIKEKFYGYELNIDNNICDATNLRQQEMKELSKKVDAVIVIGGKNSSNTKKLYDIGVKNCSKCYLIETIDDLPDDIIEYKRIGIMGGASTPRSSVDKVINKLNK